MKSCIACNAEIEDGFNFCKICGSNQKAQKNDSIKSKGLLLTILCVLTIIGSLFGIVRGWIYELVSTVGNDDYFRGWIYIFANIGTLVGAILMLKRKKIGLHLYSVFQVIYILTVIYATVIYEVSDFEGLAIVASMFFLIPSIVFLILYWQKKIVKYLH
jgi:hypothetical protein